LRHHRDRIDKFLAVATAAGFADALNAGSRVVGIALGAHGPAQSLSAVSIRQHPGIGSIDAVD
jgi:hypothetical protein